MDEKYLSANSSDPVLARHRFPCPDLSDKRRITDFSLVISANHRPVRLLIGLAVQSNKESEGNPILLETVEAEPLVVVPPSLIPGSEEAACTPGRLYRLYRLLFTPSQTHSVVQGSATRAGVCQASLQLTVQLQVDKVNK